MFIHNKKPAYSLMMAWLQVFLFSCMSLSVMANNDVMQVTQAQHVSQHWLTNTQTELAKQEYQPQYHADGLQAPNRTHQLRIYFTNQGVKVHERGQSTLLMGMRLTAYGRGKQQYFIPASSPTTQNHQVNYVHQDIVEWYRNANTGLEQGFDISERPFTNQSSHQLWLDIELTGIQRAQKIGEDISLHTQQGRKLSFAKLQADDAHGKRLPSHMEVLSNTRLRLWIDDREAAYPLVIDPILGAEDTETLLEANQVGGAFGISAVGIGDVNSDGYDDVAVGAADYDNGEFDEGAVFIYYGSASGLSNNYDVMLESNQVQARLGRSISSAGDVNGDGYNDLIVGAYFYDSTGAAFVYHGSASGVANSYDTILQVAGSARFGWSVAGVGDVNGDGYSDVMIGDSFYTDGESQEGAVFVFHGSAGGVSSSYTTSMQPDIASAQMGYSVAGAGDLNNDGYDDAIVGAIYYANGQDSEGAIFTYHGSPSGLSSSFTKQLESDQAQAYFGCDVEGAGDVNNDGFDDIIVGAYAYDNGETDEGVVFIYHGSETGIADSYNSLLEVDQANANLGRYVASAGDVNKDGYDDVIVSASSYENGQTNEGAIFIYHGSNTGVANSYTTIIEMNQANTPQAHGDVAGAGDINNDGYADVIIGAHNYENGQNNEGAAFVYFGSDVGITTICVEQTEIPKAECETLVNLYKSTNGLNWSDSPSNNWNKTFLPCSWTGVTCSDGSVTAIDRPNKNLVGTIPDWSALTKIIRIDLGDNQLTGSIPQLNTLTQLQSIKLRLNQLSGEIPDLTGLTKLHTLNTRNNQLTGNIPELSSLTSLKTLSLIENQLTGEIPDLTALIKLETFNVRNNQLNGNAPDLTGLTQLTILDLRSNQLTGTMPNVSTLTQIQEVKLDSNQFNGAIPDISGLSNVTIFSIKDNQLTGGIPNLSSLTALTSLGLSGNQFCKYANVNYSPWSSEVNIYADCIPKPPSALTGKALSPTRIDLSWVDQSDFETGFKVQRNGTLISTTAANINAYSDTGLECDTTYEYTVQTTDGSNDSDGVSVSVKTNICPAVNNKPHSPANFAASSVSNTTINLTWTDDSALESSYLLYRDAQRIARLPADTESYQDNNLTCNTSYSYSLVASNQFDDSDSVSITVKTAACNTTNPNNPTIGDTTDPIPNPDTSNPVLNPPSQLTATLKPDNTVTLNWVDNSTKETGFVVLRDNQLQAQLPENSERFIDTQINCGVTYNYVVMASDAHQNSVPASVNVVAPVCNNNTDNDATSAVAPPYNVLATVLSATTINLTWSDNNSQSTYLIKRDGIALTSVSTQYYVDAQLQCGQYYQYSVQAVVDGKTSSSVSTSVQMPACITNEQQHSTLLNLSTQGEGNIVGCGRQCVQTYLSGTELLLQVKPAAHWDFIGWQGDCDATGHILTQHQQQCIARFAPIAEAEPSHAQQQAKVSLQLDIEGRGHIQNCGIACTQVYAHGTIVSLTPIAADGWKFQSWHGECQFDYIRLQQDTVCTAIFEPLSDSEISPLSRSSNQIEYITDTYIPVAGSISHVYLQGDNYSEGLISNATIDLNASLQGGRLSSFNRNYGTVSDVDIRPYSTLEGGYIAGGINNDGELHNVTLVEGSTVTGQGVLSGTIYSSGLIDGMNLDVNTMILGGELAGEIIGDAEQPARIGAANIDGASLDNVCLTPTVQLGDEVVLGDNVTLPSDNPTILDFCIDLSQAESNFSQLVPQLEPAAFAFLPAASIKVLPPETFSLFTPAQLRYLNPEVIKQISQAQFDAIQLDILSGFTAQAWDAMPVEIIQQLNATALDYIDLQQISPLQITEAERTRSQERAASKILTNVPKRVFSNIDPARFLIDGWQINPNTLEITPLPNSNIVYRSLKLSSETINLPELPDFNRGFGVGGAGAPLLDAANTGLIQTDSEQASALLGQVTDLSKFKLTQQNNGILNVVGTDEFTDLLFAFLPDVTGIHIVAEDDAYVGLSRTAGGFFQMTMSNKQQFVMLPSPSKPEELSTIFGQQAEIQISKTGEVFTRYTDANGLTQSLIMIFNSFVQTDIEAEPLSFITDVTQIRARYARAIREGRVVFSDGSVQSIYPAVLYPNILLELLTQINAENMVYHVDGTFSLDFNGQTLMLLPTYDTQVQGLDIWERIAPNIELDNNELVYTVQDTIANQLVTSRLVISY
ncbi:FG-GAP-like repeat-containing protein [Candidatus Albibeggiatoa sp. nov. NOAA]|uniref:FG-GAP-like repeat-containing protein n=1 Tax=Candidatus Albibeggiatoa sp. nov. NOAA TaxID=3162724 RepID=UPI0032F2466F|nr:FG-GAP-like repeat-containing protein [Thiotrichaceae bacterium]